MKAIKIAGRSKDIQEKVRLVQLTHNVLKMAKEGMNKVELQQYVQKHMGEKLCERSFLYNK